MGRTNYEPEKLFTVEQANRMLPLVGRIAKDVREVYLRLVEKVEHFRRTWPEGTKNLDESRLDDVEAVRRDIEADRDVLLGYAKELAELGVVLKGEADGLVDFPSMREGRVVFLCWKLGEPEVAHWHEIDAGFAGRQPVEEPAAATGEGR